MDTASTPTTQDKQITVDVPEERVAEFYAFYARFLAGRTRGRRGPGRHGHHHHAHGHGCRARGEEQRSDKRVTVDVPAERVPEFYAWFAAFLAAEPGGGPPGRRGRGWGHHSGPRHHASEPWSAEDADQAAWLYSKLAPPARALFDLLVDEPGRRHAGNEIAARLELEKGAHGVAGILAWPGRYSRKLGRDLPIATEGREDGGTDYFMEPELAQLFAAARTAAGAAG
jgi:hypothetical protein